MKSNDNEIVEKVKKVLLRISNHHNNNIKHIIDTVPNSYTLEAHSFFLEKNEEPTYTKEIKKEYEPTLSDEAISFFKKYISLEDLLVAYDDLKFNLRSDTRKHLAFLAKETFPNHDFEIFDSIRMGSCHWYNHKRFSDDIALTIYKSLMNDIGNPFNDERFSYKIKVANHLCGKTNNNSIFSEKEFFKIRVYNKKTDQHSFEDSLSLHLDARIGIVFYFKNKPAFIVSFFIDDKMNIYIRQIQGIKNGRGHYKLGEQWQKKVAVMLKEKLSFVNHVYVISEKSMFDYLLASYKTYNKITPVIENFILKASMQYTMFYSENRVTNKSDIGSMCERIPIEDEFYLL